MYDIFSILHEGTWTGTIVPLPDFVFSDIPVGLRSLESSPVAIHITASAENLVFLPLPSLQAFPSSMVGIPTPLFSSSRLRQVCVLLMAACPLRCNGHCMSAMCFFTQVNPTYYGSLPTLACILHFFAMTKQQSD